jgi:hypothetical protein
MSAHKLVPLTLALTCICPLGKNPIFPQNEELSSSEKKMEITFVDGLFVLFHFLSIQKMIK